MVGDAGTISWICPRPVGGKKYHNPSCGKPATHFAYGMDRCEEHKIDLSPCVWEANTRGSFPFCGIDHETYGHIYGTVCRNTPEIRNQELRKLHSVLKKLKAKKFSQGISYGQNFLTQCETPEYTEGPCHCRFHDPKFHQENP